MPYSVNVHDDIGLVIAKFWDNLDVETFVDYFDTMESLGPFEAGYNLLLSISSDGDVNLPTDAIMDSARRPNMFHDSAKRVILVSDHLAYGLSRIYVSSAGTAGSQYVMARDLREAAAALNLTECVLAHHMKRAS